ncbi:glycosyltransferase family 4 protein [Tsuneonella amylolytica]|uniref:glycosyltransferase family 4 protein n=1 Tax=Tsuneonella amylolytica TaxID=2338327 RepID=UPI000EAA94D7|nr:glycosyltransferase family 4 protein [Tsuneonella amylolytica]
MSTIAYLVSDYHAPSHTFVRREVDGLRSLGETVRPFSVRGNNRMGEEPVSIILKEPLTRFAAAILWNLARHPLRAMQTWVRALSHRPPGWRGLVWSQFHFVEAMVLSRMLVECEATVLHSHFANSGATVAMLAAKLADIPWSMTLHGISETDYPAGLLLPDKIGNAAFVASASRFMLAQAMRITQPYCWDRLAIVRCGIDLSAMPPRRDHGAMVDRALYIVCVGRLSPEKGYSVLIEAVARLTHKGHRVTVDIVGDGPGRDDVEMAIREAGLPDAIRLLGAMPEARTLETIAGADIMVLPSFMEGLPVVVMEAMAIGVPVIASRVAGIPELIEDEVTGLTVTPTDDSALASAIERLAADEDLRRKIVAAGKERVFAEHSIAETAYRMKALFDKVRAR